MMDDETGVPRDTDNQDRCLYYDYFKWITTLSLVAIGGVFSLITQSDFVFRPLDLMVVFISLAIAASTALVGVDMHVTPSRDPRRLAKRSRLLKSVAVFSLGLGAGYFVMMFSEKLFA